jgi:hypothetical protein
MTDRQRRADWTARRAEALRRAARDVEQRFEEERKAWSTGHAAELEAAWRQAFGVARIPTAEIWERAPAEVRAWLGERRTPMEVGNRLRGLRFLESGRTSRGKWWCLR